MGGCGGGGVKDVGQVADGLLHEVCLSRFSLNMCKRGFQAVPRIRPSSLFMLLGCISISMASLMRRYEEPVFMESSLVS